MTRTQRMHQRGAALLAAMLTVALVATFAATAMWQQWRAIEVESAERARIQSAWILVGALDWSRLILREDALARGDRTDNLTEPWSIPLEEARLSTFLSAQRNVSDPGAATADTENAFLSGRITDLQSRMNLRNLVSEGNKLNETALRQFTRLFQYLGLPQQELQRIAQNMAKAAPAAQGSSAPSQQSPQSPLMPQSVGQLTWWGIQPSTIDRLAPHVTLLPQPTLLNINTADAEAIWASAIGLDMPDAQRIVQSRASNYFKSVEDASKLLSKPELLTTQYFDVKSSYFEIRGRMRIDQTVVEERSLVYKQQGNHTRTLWRERGGFLRDSADTLAPGKS
ncbi:type II secretion system minor pseudopilin GspK [Diaphorobacter ruginosibacter]|uniref:Type II secretion system protein K n=1 Tax=Diaphorobacter ruginosibacter TaxID=1715720 RepID=A0A7G9RQT1_9BURK|nr:type II secretion system minor pseudopilin GspK [Diaphorobacter ruginosibacter]QNN57956.1 type II secretion system minor pseudopilin GspK [Diaphorobacter ruginosibacter]